MKRSRRRGFTLIELMVVVVIVGILATLAVVGYRAIVQSSHVSEATNMVQNIRVAEEAYHSETQQYANLSEGIPTTLTSAEWYPAPPVYGVMTGWGGASVSHSDTVPWTALPLHVDGPVLFGYACIAGAQGVAPSVTSASINGQTIAFPSAPTSDWFIVSAVADLNNDTSNFTQVWGDSWTNQVFVANEGL